jgi:hypothetical protein
MSLAKPEPTAHQWHLRLTLPWTRHHESSRCGDRAVDTKKATPQGWLLLGSIGP